jgi:hypothetical protein
MTLDPKLSLDLIYQEINYIHNKLKKININKKNKLLLWQIGNFEKATSYMEDVCILLKNNKIGTASAINRNILYLMELIMGIEYYRDKDIRTELINNSDFNDKANINKIPKITELQLYLKTIEDANNNKKLIFSDEYLLNDTGKGLTKLINDISKLGNKIIITDKNRFPKFYEDTYTKGKSFFSKADTHNLIPFSNEMTEKNRPVLINTTLNDIIANLFIMFDILKRCNLTKLFDDNIKIIEIIKIGLDQNVDAFEKF